MLSITKILLILVVVLIVFGAGKLSGALGDLGRGIRNFREGLDGDEKKAETPPPVALPRQETPPAEVVPPSASAETMKPANPPHDTVA